MLADEATEWSMQYYEELLPSSDFIPDPFVDESLEPRLRANARFALQEADTEAFLEGSGIRAIHDQARSTLIHNVEREHGRWYRIPSSDACGFCRLLATRGPVYKSAHAAAASHDKCKCKVNVERPGMKSHKPSYMSGWDNEYKIARRQTIDAGEAPSLDNIVRAWNKNIRAAEADTQVQNVA